MSSHYDPGSEKDYPKASVIVINYNGHEWLKICLPSLIKTEYPRFEIIVVDNGSVDQSVNYLRNNWQQCIRLIELHENLGFAEANNIGIRSADGDIIALLNNDMEVDRNWLKSAVKVLTSNPDVAAVQSKILQYTERYKIDSAGLSFDKFGLVVSVGIHEIDHGQYDYLHEIWGCSGGAMIGWKRRLIEAGLFDEAFFIYYEDVDLSWRLKLSGYKMMLVPSSLVYHMGKASSKTIPSSFVLFHSTKNYIAAWLKNYSLRTLILKSPSICFIIVGSLLFEIVRGRFDLFVGRLKSILWVWSNLRTILRKRHKVQHDLRRKDVSDNILFPLDTKARSSNLLYIIKNILKNK